MADGEVYLMGGTITGNVAASGAGVYSEGTVYLKGTVKVSENMVKDSFNVASNVLAGRIRRDQSKRCGFRFIRRSKCENSES